MAVKMDLCLNQILRTKTAHRRIKWVIMTDYRRGGKNTQLCSNQRYQGLIPYLVVALDVSRQIYLRLSSPQAAWQLPASEQSFMWRAQSRCGSLWACWPGGGLDLSLVLKSCHRWQVGQTPLRALQLVSAGHRASSKPTDRRSTAHRPCARASTRIDGYDARRVPLYESSESKRLCDLPVR